jgi:hypothetical protein
MRRFFSYGPVETLTALKSEQDNAVFLSPIYNCSMTFAPTAQVFNRRARRERRVFKILLGVLGALGGELVLVAAGGRAML